MRILLALLAMFLAGPILDYIWITKLMGPLYLETFASFGRITDGAFKPMIWPAIAVYVVIATALMVFVVRVTLLQPVHMTALKGAFLGLCMYGLYDLTNLATITAWNVKVTAVDMAWGTFLCGILAVLGRKVLSF